VARPSTRPRPLLNSIPMTIPIPQQGSGSPVGGWGEGRPARGVGGGGLFRLEADELVEELRGVGRRVPRVVAERLAVRPPGAPRRPVGSLRRRMGGGEGRGSGRTVLIWSEYCVQIDRSRKIKKIDYFVIVYLWPGGFNRGTQNSVLRWFFSNHAFRPPRAGPGSWHPPRGLRGPASGPDGDVPPRRCPGGRGWDPPGRRVVRPAWRRRSPSASASRAARWYCGPPLAREGRRGMPVQGGVP